mgnify:CR=1 FL=1
MYIWHLDVMFIRLIKYQSWCSLFKTASIMMMCMLFMFLNPWWNVLMAHWCLKHLLYMLIIARNTVWKRSRILFVNSRYISSNIISHITNHVCYWHLENDGVRVGTLSGIYTGALTIPCVLAAQMIQHHRIFAVASNLNGNEKDTFFKSVQHESCWGVYNQRFKVRSSRHV